MEQIVELSFSMLAPTVRVKLKEVAGLKCLGQLTGTAATNMIKCVQARTIAMTEKRALSDWSMLIITRRTEVAAGMIKKENQSVHSIPKRIK